MLKNNINLEQNGSIFPNWVMSNFKKFILPEIINKEHLDQIHHLIQGVIFECCDFTVSINHSKIKENDYVYVDPPYAPEKDTSFVNYTKIVLFTHMD